MNEDLHRELLEFLNMLLEGDPVLASDMKWIRHLISKLQEETKELN